MTIAAVRDGGVSLKRRSFARGLLVPVMMLADGLLRPAGAATVGREAGAEGTSAAGGALAPEAVEAVLEHHARLAHAAFQDCQVMAQRLQMEVEAFLARPDARMLAQVRRAWLKARPWQAQTAALVADGDEVARRLLGRINPWPVNEQYLDHVEGDEDGGLVNDLAVPLDHDALLALHQRDGDENLTTGWHAIEFMLWGQDVRDDAPGERSHEDFVDGWRLHAGRRRQYLSWLSGQLVRDLEQVVRTWAPGVAGNWRDRFVGGGEASLRLLLQTLASVSADELAAGQVEAPLNSQEQEDEQSAFADDSHVDIAFGVLGVQNVWLGRYRRLGGRLLQGPSPAALLATADPAVALKVRGQIELSLAIAQALQPPFERLVMGEDDSPGRQQLAGLLESLMRQAGDFSDAAEALGLGRLDGLGIL